MFIRLKSFEEEKKMTFITAVAQEVKLSEISQHIKSPSNELIPHYLKRVKSGFPSASSALMLKRIGRKTDFDQDVIEVDIPEFEPLSEQQFYDAKEKWPCFFYNHKEAPINQQDALIKTLKIVNFLENQSSSALDSLKLSKLFDKIKISKANFLENEKQNNTKEVKKSLVDCNCAFACMIYDGEKLLSSSFDHEPIIGHAVTDSIREVSQSDYGYLCTGFEAFLFQEPCTSCAMSLVHGRIKKVFILFPGNEYPFSNSKLNFNKNLNHRFDVYFYQIE